MSPEFSIDYETELGSGEVAKFLDEAKESVGCKADLSEKYVAYVARKDGVICAAMAFTEFVENQQYWISLAFVRKEFRRKGLHTAMFERVANQAKSNGVPTIRNEVNLCNGASIAAMAKQGRKAFSTIYSYEVELEDKS